MQSLGFISPDLQATLIRLLDAAAIPYETRNSSVHVSARYEDALMSLHDAVRDIRFDAWHCFRPLDAKNTDAYRNYMRANSISHEEENQDGVIWFSVDHDENHYDWGLETFVRS